MTRVPRLLLLLVVTVLVGGAAVGGAAALLVPAGRELVVGTSTYGPLLPELSPLDQRSLILDRDGNTIAVLFDEDREPVTLAEVPQVLIDAVLTAEDRNFYEHDGVDFAALGRALVANLTSGEIEQGGSTITQQLVKNRLLTPDQDLDRKAREMILAYRLENELTKDEILERYLNTIYLGKGAYGVKSAAERYFNKNVQDLGVAEAAMLAGLINNPEGGNPIDNPERAQRRRTEVLDSMFEAGHITAAQLADAKATPLPTQVARTPQRIDSYFVEAVKSRLLRDPRLGDDFQERYNKVYGGGLRVWTTFDPRMQSIAQEAINQVLPEGRFTAAMVAVDNTNGAVRAVASGRSFEEFQYDLATDGPGRQTGSSFKGITLAAALANGYSPDDTVDGTGPCRLEYAGSAEPWELSNYADGGGAVGSIASATAKSSNCAFARIILSMPDGVNVVRDLSKRLGIDSELPSGPSITLGTGQTRPLDMAEAYSVFAADGVHHPAIFYTKVTGPDGAVLFEENVEGERVLDPNVARSVNDVLKGVVTGGTGTAARISGREVAGKTGTTNGPTDAWFVGYTPQMTAAVWMGNPNGANPLNPEDVMTGVGGRRSVTGGSFPAQIWQRFMAAALDGQPSIPFVPPDKAGWPARAFVDEDGRRAGRGSTSGSGRRSGGGTTTTDAPPPDTAPPSTAPPDTAPPSTAPPTTAPPPPTTAAPPPPGPTASDPAAGPAGGPAGASLPGPP